MKKSLAIILGILTLVIVNSNALIQEHRIKNGRSIFVKLRPVDPRSLIQGDYMILNYELHVSDKARNAIYELTHKVILKVELDDDSIVSRSDVYQGETLSANQHRLEVKINPSHDLYPASDSFLFGEGLAHCYEQARYAEFKVIESGKPLLYRLADINLKPILCGRDDIDENENITSIFDFE